MNKLNVNKGVVSDEIFKSRKWSGIEIISEKEGGGGYSLRTNEIPTQNFEIIPANHNDLHYWKILVDGKEAVIQKRFSAKGKNILSDLQKNEGLTPYEFHDKFNLHSDNLKYFSGKIIHFTDFKYHL